MQDEANVVEVELVAEAHIDCPYATYDKLYALALPGFDPELRLHIP